MASDKVTELEQLSPDEKYDLITRNLQEVCGEEKLRSLLRVRDVTVYWGTATTGKPHVGYFVPMSKIADFLKSGCTVKILLADLHAFLDNMKAPWELLNQRVRYYEKIIKAMLTSIGVPLDKLIFVKGTDFQLSREYTLDMYRLASIVTVHDGRKAGAEVVKQVESPLLSGVLYPLLQALDEEHLKVDMQFGGVDQRKIFMLAEKYLPHLKYEKRIHLMNPMVPGLAGAKMSSSEEDSKIDLLDSPAQIKKKLRRAFCEPGNIADNGLLAFCKHVWFPLSGSRGFTIERTEENGGNVTFNNYAELESSFAKQELHPSDFKSALEVYMNELLEPIRNEFSLEDNRHLVDLAYPFAKKSTQVPVDSSPAKLDLRVGKVKSVEKHPEADSLLVAKVDVGDESQRTAVIGRIGDDATLENSLRVFLCNLKPSSIRGVPSQAMMLCAFQPGCDTTEPLCPPQDSAAGDRVVFEGYEDECAKSKERLPKKAWDKLQPDLKTDADLNVMWQRSMMRTKHGCVTTATLSSASVK